ncbi:UNVERIFIED_CONTAM: hypothetical protein Sradi_0766200 [Sesamum radiatum]|uniref:DUF4283 domain-containing protein n=1 Tax=Sesamum radiatum TaxID=300843 RepID=A0AAW2VTV5_SESRA
MTKTKKTKPSAKPASPSTKAFDQHSSTSPVKPPTAGKTSNAPVLIKATTTDQPAIAILPTKKTAKSTDATEVNSMDFHDFIFDIESRPLWLQKSATDWRRHCRPKPKQQPILSFKRTISVLPLFWPPYHRYRLTVGIRMHWQDRIKIGQPHGMDSLTMKMERVTYACILVEVDAFKKLVDQVEFILSNGVVRKQPELYEFTPKFCMVCNRFGHLRDSCRGHMPTVVAVTTPTATVRPVVPKKT